MKIMLSYDANYQKYIKPIINSSLYNIPNVKIYCVITSDVTDKIIHPSIKYFVNDPKEKFGVYRTSRHIKSSAPYNFIHGLNILKDEVDKIMIQGIDAINLKDLKSLYDLDTSHKGFACIKSNKTVLDYIKSYSNIKITKDHISKYNNHACLLANTLVDLHKFHNNNGYECIIDLLSGKDMAEMVAFNMYINGDAKVIPKYYVTSHRTKRNIDEIYSLDWRGSKKPWNSKVNYLELWKLYMDKELYNGLYNG